MSECIILVKEGSQTLISFNLFDGPRGDTGLSAYELEVENGFKGDYNAWRASLIGPPVPVAAELGQSTDLAVSQKLLTDTVGVMQQANSEAVDAATLAAQHSHQSATTAGQQAGIATDKANAAALVEQSVNQSALHIAELTNTATEQAGIATAKANAAALVEQSVNQSVLDISALASTATEQAGIATAKANAAALSEQAVNQTALDVAELADIATTKAGEASDSADAAAQTAAGVQDIADSLASGVAAQIAHKLDKSSVKSGTGASKTDVMSQWAVTQALMSANPINHIGTAGGVGFGVGICPTVPAGYSEMPGTRIVGHENYGNYTYLDGSVMCWIPAYWERHGHVNNPTYGAHGLNSVSILPFSAFPDRATAALSGYSIPRAFIDGGDLCPGFMHDKYRCSNNNGTASSIKNGKPLSSQLTHSPFSGLTGSPANNYGGAFQAAKTRGPEFFPASRFMRASLATLALAHGQAATSTANCAWFDPAGVTNFPKGNNNNAFGDVNDRDISYTSDGFDGGNSALTGSGTPFARTTHNGQENGVADLNGNMYTIEPGLTCIATSKAITAATKTNPVQLTIADHGIVTGTTVMITSIAGMTELNNRLFKATSASPSAITLDDVDGTGFADYISGGSLTSGQFYIAKASARFEDFTGGNTLTTDHFGATGVAAMMEPISIPMRTDYPSNGATHRFGNAANQVLSSDVAGDGWALRGLGFPIDQGVSPAGSSLFGQDYFYQYIRNELCLLSGLSWSSGTNAGPWGVYLHNSRASSNNSVGFCAASYPVRPSGSEG